MKKVILSGALFFTFGVSAQTYFQDDFSGGIAGNWTAIDSDGDGQNWFDFDTGAPQNGVATSASWVGSPLTPDNWLISNAIDLSGASSPIALSWKAFGQDPDYSDENYSVYVATSDDIQSLLGGGAIFNEIIGIGTPQNRNVDLSSFAGQTIHIAFRHHDVTDEFRLNIDDVKVFTPASDDLELTDITVDSKILGNRTFEVKVTNNGSSTVTSFDVNYTIDGQTQTENVSGVSLTTGSDHTFNFQHNVTVQGALSVNADITTPDDDVNNNSKTVNFTFLPPVIQYTSSDINGNGFNLYDSLTNGKAIILDFMASWCVPCETSTPALSELVQNNGSGAGDVEALAITVEQTDSASVLQGLNWNGGFYQYPKFAYSQDNLNQYIHYALNHNFNPDGYIPFFVMICPNKEEPAFSTIIKQDYGYSAGMFGAYQTALTECINSIDDGTGEEPVSIVDFSKDEINFKTYPNPANDIVNIEFELNSKTNVTISIVNTVGQVVASQNIGETVGAQSIQMDVSSLNSGMYIVKVQTKNNEQTQRISIR